MTRRSASDGEATDLGGVDWHAPSPRLRSVRRSQLVALAVPLLIADLGAGLAAGSTAGLIIGAVGLILGAAALYFFMARRIRAWGYAERDDDLLVRRGLLFRRLSIIPYGRMQYIDVTAGPFERSFGLATVRMYTAAAASDARIPGLVASEAARLRDNLTNRIRGEAKATGL